MPNEHADIPQTTNTHQEINRASQDQNASLIQPPGVAGSP